MKKSLKEMKHESETLSRKQKNHVRKREICEGDKIFKNENMHI